MKFVWSITKKGFYYTPVIVLPLVFALFTILAMLFGMIGYGLLSVAFPEHITFGWHWIRFLALGILTLLIL